MKSDMPATRDIEFILIHQFWSMLRTPVLLHLFGADYKTMVVILRFYDDSAAAFAFAPRGFDGGASFLGLWLFRIALARATAV